MSNYVQQLGLKYDPFEPNAPIKEFFLGGNRQLLCKNIVERAMYSESIISVCGCLGSGKTMLASAVADAFSDEAVVATISATLFMSPEQFAEALAADLDFTSDGLEKEQILEKVIELANQLDMEAKSLLIQVDDAHELSAEVLADLVQVKSIAPASSMHLVLYGEIQLGNMLENTLPDEDIAQLAHFDLEGFGSEETILYIRFKLDQAGLKKAMPLSGVVLGGIYNSSNGVPGTINALAADALTAEFSSAFPDVEAGGSSIADSENNEASRSEYTASESKAFPLFAYGGALAVLIVLLVSFVTFVPDPQERESSSIPVTAAPSVIEPIPARSLDSIEELPTELATEIPDELPEEPAQELSEIALIEPEAVAVPASVDVVPEISSITKPQLSESIAQAENSSGDLAEYTVLSSYESMLMASPASNFTVQVLGASSEGNIQEFLADEELETDAGYFETRLNEKPWFVVVLGSFATRAEADVALASLSESIRGYGPWIRTLDGIQKDLKTLHQLD